MSLHLRASESGYALVSLGRQTVQCVRLFIRFTLERRSTPGGAGREIWTSPSNQNTPVAVGLVPSAFFHNGDRFPRSQYEPTPIRAPSNGECTWGGDEPAYKSRSTYRTGIPHETDSDIHCARRWIGYPLCSPGNGLFHTLSTAATLAC